METLGGTLISWKTSKFQGTVVFENGFAWSEFTSKLIGQKWFLTNIYTPCTIEGRVEFLSWFKNIVMPDNQSWINLGVEDQRTETDLEEIIM
jgi:hypothetical protein